MTAARASSRAPVRPIYNKTITSTTDGVGKGVLGCGNCGDPVMPAELDEEDGGDDVERYEVTVYDSEADLGSVVGITDQYVVDEVSKKIVYWLQDGTKVTLDTPTDVSSVVVSPDGTYVYAVG